MSKEKLPINIIGERDIVLNLSNPLHHEQLTRIGKVLSSPIRLQILNLLANKALSVQEIAKFMDIPVSSAAMHINCLIDAKLIVTEIQPGLRGSMRVCIASVQSIHLDTAAQSNITELQTITSEMSIGNYYSCQIEPTCGLADSQGALDTYDTPVSFYSPKRQQAQLLWFHKGFIEYRFPNLLNPLLELKELSFSLELCSEAPGYAEDWPSDITFSIAGKEIGVYRSPSDFGARRGWLTPTSWQTGRTQYGLLKTISVRKDGCFLDSILWNKGITLEKLELSKNPYISLLIQIKDDAECIGGINIFGKEFGDYPQGIIMKLIY